jgi:hypothetical protein
LHNVRPDELCQSCDAFAFEGRVEGKGADRVYVVDSNPSRAVQFICWAPTAGLPAGIAEKRRKAVEKGQTTCHNPYKVEGLVSGRHMSDRYHDWVQRFPFAITPKQAQAFGYGAVGPE